MRYIDVSASTSDKVGGLRRLPRKGIVLHTTMGTASLDWVQRRSAEWGRPASCDYLIAREGDIYQITQIGRYAFHSGTAEWGPLKQPDGTISQLTHGIEFECAEDRGQVITDLQLIAGAALCRQLRLQGRFGLNFITLHRDCATPPGRKRDPITWDWDIWLREYMFPSKEAKQLVFPAVLP